DKVKVQVADGWVTLEGNIESHYQRVAAEMAVKDLMGVKGISNFISILPNKTHPHASAVESAIKRSAHVSASKILISVDGDRITLVGSVPSLPVRLALEYLVWRIPGVSSI